MFGTWPWSAAGRGAPRRWAGTTTDVELSAGVVEYRDTGGQGPVLVLLHGLLIGGS